MRALLPLLLVLGLAPAARAQGAPPPAPTVREVLAGVLGRAKASGALSRILGERHLREEEGGRTTGLVSLAGELTDDGQAVRLALTVRTLEGRERGAMGSVAYTLGLDGALRRFEVELRARGQAEGQRAVGTIRDGHIELDGGRRVPFEADLLPQELALYFLPSLADQGLPELRAQLMSADKGPRGRSTTITPGPAPDGESVVTFQDDRLRDEDPPPAPLVVRVRARGIEMTEGAVVSAWTLVTGDEVEALKRRFEEAARPDPPLPEESGEEPR